MARFGADRRRGTASLFWRAVLSRSSPAANCRATATINRRAISRPPSTACSLHRCTLPTATRSRGLNSNTSSPGWIVSRRMPPTYTLPACRSCSPATTMSCRPIAIFIRKTPTPRMRCCSPKHACGLRICSTRAGATPYVHSIPTRRCTRIGAICGTAGRGMPGCALIFCCSAKTQPSGWSPRASIARFAAQKMPAITRRLGSNCVMPRRRRGFVRAQLVKPVSAVR